MKIYFTLTGTDYYHGKDYLKNGMRIKLIKEPDNPYDSEAIRVEMAPLSKIGYVANSTRTVIGDSWSAVKRPERKQKKSRRPDRCARNREKKMLRGGRIPASKTISSA